MVIQSFPAPVQSREIRFDRMYGHILRAILPRERMARAPTVSPFFSVVVRAIPALCH
jgi:hypothetical protein